MSDGSYKILTGWTRSHWSPLFASPISPSNSLKVAQHRCFVTVAHRVWLCSCPMPLQAGSFPVAETVGLWVEMGLLHLICSCLPEAGCWRLPWTLSCLGAEAAGSLCCISIVWYLAGLREVLAGWMKTRGIVDQVFQFQDPSDDLPPECRRKLQWPPEKRVYGAFLLSLLIATLLSIWVGQKKESEVAMGLKIGAYFPGVSSPAIENSSIYNCGLALMEPLKQTFHTPF